MDRLTAIFGSVALVSSTLGNAGVVGSFWAQTVAAVAGTLTVVVSRLPASQPPQ